MVYLAIGAGGGVTGAEVSSEEQENINKNKLRIDNSFLISSLSFNT
jgi:hypothetical protein